MRSRHTIGLVFSLLLLSCIPAGAQGQRQEQQQLAEWIRANYTKQEYRIPMRDGKHLFTAVYVPKDALGNTRYPILLNRTPYGVGPYGPDQYPHSLGPSELLARSKYIVAYQDVRGKFMSEGTFVDVRPYNPSKKTRTEIDENSDTYDTIDWLVKNIPNNNGRVGMWGISYPGFYTAMGMIDAHPALKAASPQAPIADWFIGDDFHHNGALFYPHNFGFISGFGLPRTGPTTQWPEREFKFGTQDGYNFYKAIEPLPLANSRYLHNRIAFWNEMTQHPNYDSFWQERSLPQHIRQIKPAVLVVGGWFDAEDLYGALHVYQAAAKNTPASKVTLAMGPWVHGGWSRADGDHLGDVQFGGKTSLQYRAQVEFPFFEHHLKDADEPNLPAAYVFETGSNQWKQYESWPPRNAVEKHLYFGPNGTLTFRPPQEAKNAFDEYVSDPAKPVPFLDRPEIGMAREYMTSDQRLQGRRPDVLVYQTEPLTEDVIVAGPVRPSLFVSTTGTDSDWVVKLIDVYPADTPDPNTDPTGVHLSEYEQLVRGEPMRGRFRNSFAHPEPFIPGQITKVEFVEPDVNHTFLRGHRIMVQVQSSWFPLVDLNPQKFVDIYTAKPEDFQKATQRVYFAPDTPSQVKVLVLTK